MKYVIIFAMLILTSASSAITWKVEIKDVQSSEVKTYKFTKEGTQKLELPKFEIQGCLLKINPAVKDEAIDGQGAQIQCFAPTGGVFIQKACLDDPSSYQNRVPVLMDIVEDGAKSEGKKDKKKPGKFSSYSITMTCE